MTGETTSLWMCACAGMVVVVFVSVRVFVGRPSGGGQWKDRSPGAPTKPHSESNRSPIASKIPPQTGIWMAQEPKKAPVPPPRHGPSGAPLCRSRLASSQSRGPHTPSFGVSPLPPQKRGPTAVQSGGSPAAASNAPALHGLRTQAVRPRPAPLPSPCVCASGWRSQRGGTC